MDKRPTGSLKLAVAVVAAAAVVWVVQAGSLEPPGPPAPTMKPLDQVEARTPISNVSFLIAAPGSYYLTEDLTAAAATGLSIGSDDVTFDLNGFAVVGSGAGGIHGINVAGADNVTIANGTVRGFARGIDVDASTNVTLTNLRVMGNLAAGIGGFDSTFKIDGCSVENNGGAGIDISSDFFNVTDTLIENCSVVGNGGDGITADATVLEIRNNRVHLNGERGIEVSMTNAKIVGNRVDLNNGTGISTGIASGVVSDNLVFSNGLGAGGGFGIEVVLAEAAQFVARNQAAGNVSGDYSIDAMASAAPISTLDASPGAWDNLIPNLP